MRPMKKNALEFLRKHSMLSLDSSNFQEIPKHKPISVTTNPSLILRSIERAEYWKLVWGLLSTFRNHSETEILNQLLVFFAKEISCLIPGHISIELNANLAFRIEPSLRQAEDLIRLSNQVGLSSRILIKVPATWEGIQVCQMVGGRSIRCNMTLVFSLMQAALCQKAKAHTISPFVGRVTDYFNDGINITEGKKESLDPGVYLLNLINKYYEQHPSQTQIMAASFRNIHQILAVVGCDSITISPNLIENLRQTTEEFEMPKPQPEVEKAVELMVQQANNKNNFYKILRQNKLASVQLLKGITKFTKDSAKLTSLLRKIRLGSCPIPN
ncbi:transaldolase B [Candidatus Tremblaya phenacola PAVE]|nr:transaldolase B [Candidatus Tremblaya phenacola PAVE]